MDVRFLAPAVCALCFVLASGAALAAKPVKPAPANASAYPVFVDSNGKVVGPAIFGDDTGVAVRLENYLLQLGLQGLDNDNSYDFSKADWVRFGLLFEQVGCGGTAYVPFNEVDRGNLGFSARTVIVRDPVTLRDVALVFPPDSVSARVNITIRSNTWDGICYDLPEPISGYAAIPVGTEIDIGSLYVPPFTLK